MRQKQISATTAGGRLDVVATDWLKLSRSQITKAIKSGEVTLNGLVVKPGEIVARGDKLKYDQKAQAKLEAPHIAIVYEDGDILVVDKPAGLIVHPTGKSGSQVSLVDFAKLHSLDRDSQRPGIVHRLDRETSGLIILAKTAAAKQFLQRQFQSRKVEKEYIALVHGTLPKASAEINLPISAGGGIKRQVAADGRPAVTKYQVTKRFDGATLLTAWPQTGRTHQLRVHFSAIGHSIVGDDLYGKADPKLNRYFLHAHRLVFQTPSKRRIEVTSPLPRALQDYLAALN